MIRQKTSQFFLKTNVFVKIPFLHFACVWFHIIQIIHSFCSVWLLTKIHCHLLGTTQFPWFSTCSTCGKEWILWMTFFTFNLLQEKAKFKVTITELIRVLIAVFSPCKCQSPPSAKSWPLPDLQSLIEIKAPEKPQTIYQNVKMFHFLWNGGKTKNA